MKYCGNCGTALPDEANACSNCGTFTNANTATAPASAPAATAAPAAPKADSGIVIAVKILLILATVGMGWMLIPLAWCIPMTVSYFNAIKEGRPVSIALKVCTLLFMSTIAGILMLCDQEH